MQNLRTTILPALCLGAAVYLFTIGILLDHTPGKDVAYTLRKGRASSSEISEVAEKGDDSKNELSVYIEVFSKLNCKGERARFESRNDETMCERCVDMCHRKFGNGDKLHDGIKSMRFVAKGPGVDASWYITAYTPCSGTYYYKDASIRRDHIKATQGCVNFPGDSPNMLQFKNLPAVMPNEHTQSYHVAYSAESSSYFGFQAFANYYAFQDSGQIEGTGYTRLLTSSEIDDLADKIPTFQAPRDALSYAYSPINKPDIVAKWFESDSPPKEDVIVLIDPDNWLLQSLHRTANKVKKGHGVAQQAFFYKNPLVMELYQLFCKENCGYRPDDAAVPYFVHRDDLRQIAPLWRDITKQIVQRTKEDRSLLQKFKPIQLDWCAEMYGYIFAAAELGITHTIKGNLQLRDVDTPLEPKSDQANKMPMIHMGRAWFPDGDKSAAQWAHTEGRNFAYRGIQVWCKCNWTASHIVPWPVPEGTDFASRVTLEILHNSQERFGALPDSKYRHSPSNRGGFNWKYP